jgi:Ser/Thr protein kinase RdoA (MazF antagonist)
MRFCTGRCCVFSPRQRQADRGMTPRCKAVVRTTAQAHSDEMLSRRAQLTRLRRVAEAALSRYPIADGRLRFVAHEENTTYRHDGADGSHLVRVHRPHRHGRGVDTTKAIRSEIAWLQAVRKDTGLAVPVPVAARDGAPTVTVATAGEERVCSVLRWMDGRIHESSPRPVHLRRLGEAMARLHDQADAWTPPPDFVRIRWDHETFFGNVMVYGETAAAECWELLPGEVRARFEAVEARMADILPRAGGTGLIHADLHLGNALFQRGAVKLIDFDDCGTGPRLYELAVALWELRDAQDYPAFRDALLSGYRTRRDIDVGYLDDFIALRQVAFDLWYTGTAQVNPAFSTHLDKVHRWSLAMLDLVEAS